MDKVMFHPLQKFSQAPLHKSGIVAVCFWVRFSLEVTFILLDWAGQSLKTCLEPKDVLLSSYDLCFKTCALFTEKMNEVTVLFMTIPSHLGLICLLVASH